MQNYSNYSKRSNSLKGKFEERFEVVSLFFLFLFFFLSLKKGEK